MFATHDPRLIEIGIDRAEFHGNGAGTFEFQMLYGIRPDEQRRLAAARAHRARLRPLRRAVVRLPDAAAGRATGQPGVLRPLPGLEGLTADGRHDRPSSAAARSARRCSSGLLRGERDAGDIVVVREAPRAGRATSPSTYGVKALDVAEAAAAAPHARPRGQAAGHRRAARRARAGRSTRSTWSSRCAAGVTDRPDRARAAATACRSCGACRTPRRSSTRR